VLLTGVAVCFCGCVFFDVGVVFGDDVVFDVVKSSVSLLFPFDFSLVDSSESTFLFFEAGLEDSLADLPPKNELTTF
jgi:hypothetical protein